MTDYEKLFIEAMAELKPEIENTFVYVDRHRVAPNIKDVIMEFSPIPPEALFIGMASDGLPVLLNLHDPIPQSILVIGDSGSGKTDFLRVIADGIRKMHEVKHVQFAVITNHPDEWDGFECKSTEDNSVGVFPFYHQSAEDLLLSLASWAHAGNKKQAVVLLIDGFENVTNLNFDAKQNLRWLLLRGASRRVWTISTINTEKFVEIESWQDSLRTRIFGKISDFDYVKMFDLQNSGMENLGSGLDFLLREGEKWLQFWKPSL